MWKCLHAFSQVLPGDHTRPLLQTVGDLPAEVRQAASAVQSQGGELLNRLSSAAVQAGFSQVRHRLTLLFCCHAIQVTPCRQAGSVMLVPLSECCNIEI